MIAAYQEAVDSISGLFYEQFEKKYQGNGKKFSPEGTPLNTVEPYVKVLYENIPNDTPNTTFVRFVVRHFNNAGQTLSGGTGTIRRTRAGTAVAQIFIPMCEGVKEAYELATEIAQVYEGKVTNEGVWFLNVRVNEIGPDGAMFQVNVLIDFRYDVLTAV